jgi:hypothetical protein
MKSERLNKLGWTLKVQLQDGLAQVYLAFSEQ